MSDFIDFEKHVLDQFGKVCLLSKEDRNISATLPYGWFSTCNLLDESSGRRVIGSRDASEFRYSEWSPITKEEYDLVKSTLIEVWYIRRCKKLEYLVGRK